MLALRYVSIEDVSPARLLEVFGYYCCFQVLKVFGFYFQLPNCTLLVVSCPEVGTGEGLLVCI